MAEYIEREAAVAVFEERQKALCPVGEWSRNKAYDREKFDAWEEILDELRAIPAADVAPVRHGTWLLIGADKRGRGGIFECSACNGCSPHKDPYCPKCGAKMDGKSGDA